MKEYFDTWDSDKSGAITLPEFTQALRSWDLHGIKPRRVSVERVVSGPGLASVYGFLRKHWAYERAVDAAMDAQWEAAAADKRGALVANCAKGGNPVCAKAVEIFQECYGSEVGVAAPAHAAVYRTLSTCYIGRASPSSEFSSQSPPVQGSVAGVATGPPRHGKP